MEYPEFFDRVEKITLYDPLAEFLGSFKDGIIEYGFTDIVKATGHGCVTVAGAYLATVYGLKALYKNGLPERGKIKVELPQAIDEGTQGVIASVITHITGATSNQGFKGLNGKFSRTNLMFFNTGIQSFARFTRIDNNKSVDVFYFPQKLVSPGNVLGKMLSISPSDKEFENYQNQWLEIVKTVLENPDKVIEVKEV
ncbi:conserved hypothetical protein [Thermotomaculum hydrothermale]|uniref:Formylmethanofuran dehydrogenase subunit E domain-containing protein n=1 Tax=Thermotomaculum hydrothermale TaxID=981385 RepID=A0A7R6PGY0_9BACT|nr:hypothetical protein [Thermotomaculum hydrothermale]BBB33529.1 conserved hypothetical protein [Thermotomaculum hydrothermale]